MAEKPSAAEKAVTERTLEFLTGLFKAIVIDCGYHSDGKGDIDFVPDCEYFTPVPGGVGPMTIASVIKSGYYLRTLKNDN